MQSHFRIERMQSKSMSKSNGGGSLISKVFKRRKEWDDKEELLDIIYWLRQVIAVTVGLVWTLLHLQGIIGILSFFVVSSVLVYVYHAYFHGVDDEEFGGLWELIKEGMMTSFALFLVIHIYWVKLYNLR